MTSADEVAAVLERFRAGWEALDADAVLDCFADSEETVVIGTDADEYWRGSDSFAEPFRAMGAAFEEARYGWAQGPVITVQGTLAWADGVLDTALTAGGHRVEARLRTTWVLRAGPSGWKVAQAHFSVAPPAAVAPY